MASLRKASSYSKKYARPYTRVSRKKSKAFIKAVPQKKLVKRNMGDIKGYNSEKFKTSLNLISEEKVQIRDNALEACRQSISRELDKKIPNQFYFEVKVFPHHIMRENKMLTGAGADRMSSGMKHSYGKAAGRAALVNPNQTIFLIATNGDKNIALARETLKAVKAKIPGRTKLTIEKKNQ